MREFAVSAKKYSDESTPFIIAEVGHNHQGSLETALKLIRAASHAGASAVKFQKRSNKSLFSQEAYDAPYTGENSFGATYGLHREALEFGVDEYKECINEAKRCQIDFFATAFDFESADFLDNFEVLIFLFFDILCSMLPFKYKLNHTCEAIGKTGISKNKVCGKQAYFEVKNELDVTNYYCRIHDPLKKSRESDEKYQKRDVSYNYTVVQPHTNPETGEIVNKGVLPALLEELYSERKRVKREMARAAAEGNKLLESILDSTQLAIKVSLNSTYGFLGRGQGNLILKELGSIVTAVGRMLIEQSKEYAEGPFIDYIRENNLLKQKIEYRDYGLSESEKRMVL